MTDSEKTAGGAELYAYVLAHNPPLDAVQRGLVTTTRERFPESAQMQSAQELGPLLAFLVRLIDARHVVEVGTFTGFSALSMAQALPEDGALIACDVSEEWTAYGRQAWAEAGVADRVDLRIAPALETLRAMPDKPHIDLAYLDADKGNYTAYWEELVPRIRAGGLIVADNVLFGGQVTAPTSGSRAEAIARFNDRVRTDERVEAVMLAIADGLTVVRKR